MVDEGYRTLEVVQALGLPEGRVPAPAADQIRIELTRSGTLMWLLQDMIETAYGLQQQILSMDMSAPEALMNMVKMQAKREILLVMLGQLTDIVKGENYGD